MPEDTIIPSNYEDTPNPRPELSAKPANKKPIIIAVISVFGFFAISLGFGIWLYNYPLKAAILRDITIIYLGFGLFAVILLLIMLVVIIAYLVLKVNDLVVLLDREIKPMLIKVQESLDTVRGTTTFISDQAVQPIIKTAGAFTAVRVVIQSLFGRK